MFEMLEHHGHEDGSGDRYFFRMKLYSNNKKPIVVYRFWWFVHNCIAHFLIGIMPFDMFFKFHDWTAKKMNTPK